MGLRAGAKYSRVEGFGDGELWVLRAKAVLRWCAGDACRESCGEKVLLLLVVLKTRILFGAAKTGKGRGAMMQTRALAANYGVQSANSRRKDVWEL